MSVEVLAVFVLLVTAMIWEAGMLDLSIENVSNVAVIRCSGRIVRSSAAYQLRNAVASELDSRAIVLDISEVEEVEGGGLGMLVFLQRWARDHGIQFKLFNPSRQVREKLERAGSISEVEIASVPEVMALANRDDHQYSIAA
jgi:anti-anti-sigma factor